MRLEYEFTAGRSVPLLGILTLTGGSPPNEPSQLAGGEHDGTACELGAVPLFQEELQGDSSQGSE